MPVLPAGSVACFYDTYRLILQLSIFCVFLKIKKHVVLFSKIKNLQANSPPYNDDLDLPTTREEHTAYRRRLAATNIDLAREPLALKKNQHDKVSAATMCPAFSKCRADLSTVVLPTRELASILAAAPARLFSCDRGGRASLERIGNSVNLPEKVCGGHGFYRIGAQTFYQGHCILRPETAEFGAAAVYPAFSSSQADAPAGAAGRCT